MNERRQSFPPVVEVPEGHDQFLANLEPGQKERDFDAEGRMVEVSAGDFWRKKMLGEHAAKLLAEKGELLGVVTRTNPKTGEKTPLKVVNLSNEDLGTDVDLNNPNYRARSAQMGLPENGNALQEVFEAREEAKKLAETVAQQSDVHDPGVQYRAVRERRARERTQIDDDDMSKVTYMR